jgi:putative SOS response-associated peptidase YedK
LPTFKPHLQNRCLILAAGFFEKGIRFIQPGEPLFAIAGLWQPDAEDGKFTMLGDYEKRATAKVEPAA